MTEDKEKRKKRILYQTWYRGCKETDRILGRFARQHIEDFSDDELDLMEIIMAEDDKDLFNWITGKEPLPEKYINNNIMELLLSFDVSSSN